MGTIPDVAQVLMIPVHQIYVSTMAEDNSVTGYESERLKTEFRGDGCQGEDPVQYGLGSSARCILLEHIRPTRGGIYRQARQLSGTGRRQ